MPSRHGQLENGTKSTRSRYCDGDSRRWRPTLQEELLGFPLERRQGRVEAGAWDLWVEPRELEIPLASVTKC